MPVNTRFFGTFAIFCFFSADIYAVEPEIKFNLLTLPSARTADARLTMPALLNYQHAPLRLCLAQLSERFQFSYWIDRRVDLDKPLSVACTGSLRECLSKLAAACDCEVGLIENVVTFAKADHLANMQYVAVRFHDQLMQSQAAVAGDRAGGAVRSADAALKTLEWNMLTTPNQLLEMINKQWSITLAAELPHDLMNAGQLQACTLPTQLTLLFGGFDQCVVGKRLTSLKVIQLPQAADWQASYTSNLVNTKQAELLSTQFTTARLTKAERQWQLMGSTKAHLFLLERNASGGPTPRPPRGGRNEKETAPADPLSSGRYNIARQANVPLGAVLDNLGQQLGLKIQWDAALPPSAKQSLVTIEANNSKLDEILRALAAQAKLSIVRDGQNVSVTKSP